MKIKFPWYVRLGGIIGVLIGPLSLTFANPYWIWGGKEAESARRFKYINNVHYKKKEDVQVNTPEGDAFYAKLEEGDQPEPTFATILTEADVQQHGLLVIGSKLMKPRSPNS
jgi:hypothetical protein